MVPTQEAVAAELGDAVAEYQANNDMTALQARLAALVSVADAGLLAAAVEPYRELPEVAGPLFEKIVAARPDDARALVVLANAYWLAGRGPDAVAALASRALAIDPANRGAWHLWALSEGAPRARMTRWQQVSMRFPDDDLARANLADNAASVAHAEHDPAALGLALEHYRALLARAEHPAQRAALDAAIRTLSAWRL